MDSRLFPIARIGHGQLRMNANAHISVIQSNLDNFRFKNIKLTSCIYGGAINLVKVPEVYFAKIHLGFRVEAYCK